MAILIGHASIDENGNAKGGAAGDQTGKEVCTRTWYSKPWGFVLRCKDSAKAEKMAVACEKGCANDKIGYDQNQRNTLNTQAKAVGYDLAKITVACETDCSAFMTVCTQAAGINVPYNGTNAPTTSTMKTAFTQTGEFEVLTDSKYLTNDTYLKRGDILVKSGSHTVMALQNGSGVNVSNTTTNTSTSTQSNITYGMDVSSYQGTIDWTKVKNSNIKFVILRGVLKNGTLDTTFEKNYSGAVNNGISVIGVYHFSYALDEATAKNDAANMISKLNGKKLDIYLDLEWSTQRSLGKAKVTSIAKAYINKCASLGYNCHIYSNLDWYKNVYDAPELKNMGCKFWIARYPSADNGTVKDNLRPNVGEYIWQYSSNGMISGISSNVDLNIIYGKVQETMVTPKSSTTASSSNTTYTKTQFIKDVQSAIDAKVDGIAGSETLSKTITVSKTKNNKHAVVKPIQKYLYILGYTEIGEADGIAGTKFDTAVKAYQKAHGCVVDGEITAKANTWKSLLGLR